MAGLKALAKELLHEVQTANDYEAARTLLLDRIIGTTKLSDLQRWAIEYAVEAILRREWGSGRRGKWETASHSAAEPNEPAFGGGTRPLHRSRATFVGRRQFAEAVKGLKDELLMEWELDLGVRMRNATRPLLLKLASRDETQSVTMHQRATWYRRVAALLPNDTTEVWSVLREADLEREQRKAKE